MKDENGELIPEGTPIINDEAVHELACDHLDISQTNCDATSRYAELMDMTWSDEANGWVDWNEISLKCHNCNSGNHSKHPTFEDLRICHKCGWNFKAA
jgi:hypothetical protein